jgi:hypothetical protein
MDWLSKYDGVIQCARKAVKLTKKDGTFSIVPPTAVNTKNRSPAQPKKIKAHDVR